MTIKEKTILEDRLNGLEADIEIVLQKLREKNDYSRENLNEYTRLAERRQELIDLVFKYGYWFKRLHDEGWEIDEKSFD